MPPLSTCDQSFNTSSSSFGTPGSTKSKSSRRSTKKVVSLTKEQRPKHSVSFEKYDLVYDIPHIDDMDDKEVDSIWYTPDELKQITKNAKNIIREVNAGVRDVCGNDDDVLGLEKHTSYATKLRKDQLNDIYDTVLGIQSFQNRRGLSLPNTVADICRKQTQSSRQEAYEKAIRDALAILEE